MADLRVHAVDDRTRAAYLTAVRTVFDRVDPAVLEKGTHRFGPDTRLYAFEDDDGTFVSVLFLTPVRVGELELGGIGGVCTLPSHRGLGLGTALLRAAIDDTRDRYDALMLWTRIPDYFAAVGFRDITDRFEADPAGSTPMLLCHRPTSLAAPLPREYF